MIDHANVQRARLQTDNIKWLVGKYAPRTYGDKPVSDDGESKQVTFRWLSAPTPIEPAPEPPRQIEYHRPELPGDLTEQDWSIMLEVLELVKRTVPTNDERPPSEIFAVMRTALMDHFR